MHFLSFGLDDEVFLFKSLCGKYLQNLPKPVKSWTLKLQLKFVTGANKYLLNEIKDVACLQKR